MMAIGEILVFETSLLMVAEGLRLQIGGAKVAASQGHLEGSESPTKEGQGPEHQRAQQALHRQNQLQL